LGQQDTGEQQRDRWNAKDHALHNKYLTSNKSFSSDTYEEERRR
jgi:hypothetical protein